MNFFKHNIYKIVSSVFYIVVGLLLIFTEALLPARYTSKRMLGAVIVAYGVFRAAMAFINARKDND